MLFALVWNVLILGNYTGMCLVEGVAFFDNIEVDSWLGFYFCSAMATAVWFYIGYALRKEYVIQKDQFVSSFKDINRIDVERLFKLNFISRYTKILTVVFVTAIPWYMIAHVRSDLKMRDIIFIGIFIVASVVCFSITKHLIGKIRG